MILKRPRCENCGRKIYPMSRPWSNVDHLLGDIPLHCPNCGEKISLQIKDNANKYGANVFLIQCCCGITFIISLVFIILYIPNVFI